MFYLIQFLMKAKLKNKSKKIEDDNHGKKILISKMCIYIYIYKLPIFFCYLAWSIDKRYIISSTNLLVDCI
jgi:hypothetical protein